MGQRLNIEIVENGKCLANAYYHWSAYTDSSYDLARSIINAIPTINEENSVLRAIRLLEVTGARLMEDDLDYAKEIINIAEKYLKEEQTGEELFLEPEDNEDIEYESAMEP